MNCIVCDSNINIVEVEGPNHTFWKCMNDEQCKENLTNQKVVSIGDKNGREPDGRTDEWSRACEYCRGYPTEARCYCDSGTREKKV